SSTCSTFPELEPLCQTACRVRLQKCASPVSTVRASASRSMYATIRTAPVVRSWAIATIRPRSSKVRPAESGAFIFVPGCPGWRGRPLPAGSGTPRCGKWTRPADCVEPGRGPTSVREDHPSIFSRGAFRIDRHDHALRAEGARSFRDQLRAPDRRRLDRDLVGAGAQQRPDLVDLADAPADCERNEDFMRRLLDELHKGRPALRRRVDIEERELVRAVLRVASGERNGIPLVP